MVEARINLHGLTHFSVSTVRIHSKRHMFAFEEYVSNMG